MGAAVPPVFAPNAPLLSRRSSKAKTMGNEVVLGFSARLLSKAQHVGWFATVRMSCRKALRPWLTSRHRARVLRQPYRVERSDLASALDVTLEDLPAAVERVRVALTQRLPVSPQHHEAIRRVYMDEAPGLREATIASADRICAHVFDLLGSGPVALGTTIDWHRDFKSGYRWNPDQCFLDVSHGHHAGVDIKVPWELSRGHHLVLLAQTALLTGNSKYAQECLSQLTGWIEGNPTGWGVNWACPMDVAIRAVNWLWSLVLLAESPLITTDWLADVLASLVAHGRFLIDNLEVRDDDVTTNHYLADLVGLLYLGLCLKEVRDAESWTAFAVRALVREMDRQVLADGVHYESSLSYHRLVTEMFLSSAVLCRCHGVELPATFHGRLAKMCEFVAAYTKPNGLAPQIGDGDNGRLHILTGYGHTDVRDHRHLLAVGAVLFDRAEWCADSGSSWVEGVWFGGIRGGGQHREHVLEECGSATFPAGGFYILRKAEDYVLFNCNAPGTQGVGTHKHNDLLSLEMHLGGEDILVDSGCFLYTSDPQSYDRFRSTLYHSTVRVDQAEQNRYIPGKSFCLHPDSRVYPVQWDTGGSVEQAAADHDGYGRLPHPVRHRREIRADWLNRSWRVMDYLFSPATGSHPHCLEWTLIFSPECSVQRVEAGWSVMTPRQQFLLDGPQVSASGTSLSISPQLGEHAIAEQYGRVRKASLLRWSWEGSLPVKGVFTISLAGSGAGSVSERRGLS